MAIQSGPALAAPTAATDRISQHLSQTAAAVQATLTACKKDIAAAAALLLQLRDRGGTVFVAGNGGSAATAAHLANDLVKVCAVRAICLTDNTPLLTAYSNDIDYSSALSNILVMLARPGDVLFLISVSGGSANIIEAMFAVFKQAGYEMMSALPAIGLGSQRRDSLAAQADIFIEAQSSDMRTAEDVHLAVCHAIVAELEDSP